ncbi:hypothetical protein MLC59_01875 [Marinobacter bryozoorum]|uniref:hypothetical protein n=1 Tax=Marinobacter bryozoorum TaxID=256324 RepID=UPI002005195A|nr:hypothetical protein [Marinobacter bryozoorum]MCK7542918.1 hypothetical protein [Marinobacter bryozoorum]
MGNHVIVMDGDRNVIGEMNNSLVCFAAANKIVEKYTGEPLPVFGDMNAALNRASEQCQDYEDIQLLLFINDKSAFDSGDIPKFDEAIEKWDIPHEGPKRQLGFIRDMLKKHGKIITEYSGVSTVAIATHPTDSGGDDA